LSDAIAVVGLAGRYPGAADVRSFWRHLAGGVESIRRYTDDELREAGVSTELLSHPRYVKAGAPLEGMDRFDADFFGFSPKDAAIMDPQHRHFLECAWEALEDASHTPDGFDGSIGVWAGCGMNAYMMFNLLTNPELMETVGLFLIRHTGNDKDFLATRASYNLDLRGPSVSVQTACSTSLVAIHMAAQSLLNGEVDMALAGGVTLEQPHRRGYLYEEGEILSPDGHCRAFDHRSKGTVFGSGVGIAVLRRLDDAIEDGDHIYATLIGSAINNDGAAKVGYLAPSVDGQAAAIAEALAVADVDAGSIQYVASHGTGTPVGDPIEIAALTQAFRATSDQKGYCALGSIKTNIGHLDTAAGIASFTEVALALEHRRIPPSLNFEAPNPAIDFEASPFYVNTELREWPRLESPRRAGVSSLGVGGTNAHAILEEAPEREPGGPGRAWQVLPLSARNPAALAEAGTRLAAHLRENPDLPLADVAWTLQVGRRAFPERRTLVCRDVAEAVELLEGRDQGLGATGSAPEGGARVAFMFPGGGAQYPRMGRDLYESEAAFRSDVDRGLALLREREGLDLAPLLFPDDEHLDAAERELERPSVQLPLLFVLEHALARMWMSWGIQPTALVGHSMGENTAACIAGVMSYEDCLGLVALRGRLFERVPAGGMLSVPLDRDELEPLLGDDLALAVENAPGLCVASGPMAALEDLEQTLAGRGVEVRRVKIEIAAHSRMLDPILREFGDYLRGIELSPPAIPFASNQTGTWITGDEATDPEYWVRHLRSTVRFADDIATLLEDPARVLLEVGPGKTLSSLARMNDAAKPGLAAIASLRHPGEQVSDLGFALGSLGRLFTVGAAIDWRGFHGDARRLRVPLPAYAFQHKRYWIEPGKAVYKGAETEAELEKLEELDDWFYRPVWQRVPIPVPETLSGPAEGERSRRWLVFLDTAGVGARLTAKLREAGDAVVTVREGDAYYRVADDEFALAPEEGRAGYDALLGALAEDGALPDRIVHLWTLTEDREARPGSSFYHHIQERGFFSLLFLAQALGDQELPSPIHLSVVSNGAQPVDGEIVAHPEKATLLGPCKVIPQEFPDITCAYIDVALPRLERRFSRSQAAQRRDTLADQLFEETRAAAENDVVAYRGGDRFELSFEQQAPEPLSGGASRLREGGTYLVTGGLGGLGLVVAEHLARRWKAKLILLGRSPLPDREDWESWLATHGPGDRTSRKLRRLLSLLELGAEVEIAAGDVADLKQMERVIARATERFGAIHGVFHAAGILDDDLIQLKTQTAVDELFAPKIQGALVLDQLLGGPGLDFLALFSSTSSALGAAGQVDYVAANSFLNAFAHARAEHERPYVVALNWGVWNEVGMAAETVAAASGGEDCREPEPTSHPLLEGRTEAGPERWRFVTELDARGHWILDQHRTADGRAILPGTGYLELARGALAEAVGEPRCELRDLVFLAPLAVDDGRTRTMRVALVREGRGFDFSVESRPGDVALAPWTLHAEGHVRPLTDDDTVPTLDLAAVAERCQLRIDEDEGGLRTGQERHLRFGARWRCLQRVAWGDGEALADLALPAAFAGETADLALHPALVDLATGFGMELIENYAGDTLWVPLSYGRLRCFGPLPARIRSHVRGHPENHADREVAVFDVTLCDEDGRVVAEIESFQIKRLGDQIVFARDTDRGAGLADAHADGLSPAERAFRRTLRAGILPEEGIEALERVLASDGGPQVMVTSIALEALVQQVRDSGPQADEAGARFARPDLASNFVAPRDDVEAGLVAMWEELLGVDQVGVEDDFFALGGHSLIAVRLFGQIKRKFDVEYPISVLFEAPTVEKVAELIKAERGDSHQDSPARRREEFRFLVPMHSAESSSQLPFFLVAGMFGNVLNLRHLAGLIGRDRPFYAIQARGLRGDEQPHEDFGEAARDYLEEIRRVQPGGPYLLGGFSGGGITAYEVAQQLRESGDEVGLLAMLDTPLPRSPDRVGALDKLKIHLQRLRRRGPGYLADWVRRRIEWELRKRTQSREEAGSRPYEFRSQEIEAAFYRALGRYEIRPFPARVELFRPAAGELYDLGGGRRVNDEREFYYDDNGWSHLVPEVSVHEVPGDHDSMVLEPNVRVMAARLREALEAADPTS
jgi:acyl transferase domain-containing protein/thioesterase domain-containing protein